MQTGSYRQVIDSVVNLKSTADYSIQVFFQIPPGTVTQEEAVRIANLKEEGVHVVVHPR
jgi:hypothetical protein